MSVVEPNPILLAEAAHGHRSMLRSQVIKFGCKLTSVLLLARLVTPDDHGLFAMASSVVLLLTLFRDAGLGAAAVQAASLSEVQLTALFWCHLSIGVLLTLATLATAPWAAMFYANPAVSPLLAVMSSAFLLIGAGGFVRAQLERASRFAEVSWIESVAAVGGTLGMIGAALAGAGAYSFAVYLILSEALATALAWRACRFRPSGSPRWASLRGLLRTGTDVMTYQTIVYFLQQVDGIAVGRWFGAHSLGLYNRANQLLALPNLYIATPLNQVALVTLSRIGRDSAGFVSHARTTATVIAHLILPLFAICVVLPAETLRLVLGPQWPEAAPLLRVLSIASAAATLTSLGYAINVAAGQTRRLVVSAACALPLTIAAVWLALPNGPIGIARAIAVMNGVLLIPRLWWALRELPEGLPGYLRALTGPFLCSAAVTIGLWCGSRSVGEVSWAWRLTAGCAGAVLAILAATAVSARLRREWKTVVSYLPIPGRHPVEPVNG
ncbi:MAG: oligosaccharide flippase family protein [Opitutus sp.]